MTFTIPYIKQKYSEYNELIFGGELPELPIGIFRARSYLGKCIFRRRRTFFGKVELHDLHLRFSTFYDLPEDELDDIIIHEMIHCYILLNRLRDTSSHGRLFRQMMSDINNRFSRHITISHRSGPKGCAN